MSYYSPEQILIDIEIPHYIFFTKIEKEYDVVNEYLSKTSLFLKYEDLNDILNNIFDLIKNLDDISYTYELHWISLQFSGIEKQIMKIDNQLANLLTPKVIYHSFINSLISILKYYNLYKSNRLDYVFETIINTKNDRYTVLFTRKDIFINNLTIQENLNVQTSITRCT